MNTVPAPAPAWANPNVPPAVTTVQQHEEEFFAPLSTLDEPVMETIMRDVRSVGSKLQVVLLPMDRNVSHFLSSQIVVVLRALERDRTSELFRPVGTVFPSAYVRESLLY